MHHGYGKGSLLNAAELRDILKCVRREFNADIRDSKATGYKAPDRLSQDSDLPPSSSKKPMRSSKNLMEINDDQKMNKRDLKA